MATHLMGGEITARQISGNDYEITLTAYRDTLGIPMATYATFEIMDGLGTVIGTSTASYDTLLSGYALAGYPYGVEVYVFMDTVTLPGTGTYFVSWYNCCRNGAIQNMTAPLSENMYLETMVTVDSAANSTPFFLVQPVVFLPENVLWQYNPLPFDPDGDSLYWSLDVPLNDFGMPVTGYTLPPADPLQPFTLDPLTGTITWIANTLGNFNATVLVEEFRGGVKIGEIRRDMQFIVVASGNKMAQITNFDDIPKNSQGYPYVSLKAFQTYTLSLLASDEDAGDNVYMESYGEPFLFDQNYAQFSTSPTGSGNEIEGSFSWTPELSMVRQDPYIVVFRVKDDEFARDYTVLMGVSAWATGIDEIPGGSVGDLYPNPVQDLLMIPIELDRSASLGLSVYSLTGAKVAGFQSQNYPAGNQLLSARLELANGAYMVAIEKDGKPVQYKKIMVAK
jgi:hypothetical protein